MKPQAILVTGGTGKIGRRLVDHFHSLGRVVVFTSVSNDEIDETISGRGDLYGINVNFREECAVASILSGLERIGVSISALVNNARDLTALDVGDDGVIPEENWLAEYKIDVVMPYRLSVALAQGGGLKKIVNVSSMYGINAFNPHLYGDVKCRPPLQYACAKAALIHLTKCLAVQFAPDRIAVNCVTFGGVEGRVDDGFKKRYANLCPIGRMLMPDETVGAVDFLLSDKSVYMTGQNIVVDGGWGIW